MWHKFPCLLLTLCVAPLNAVPNRKSPVKLWQAKAASRGIQEAFSNCLGDHSLMFITVPEFKSRDSIDKMLDVAKSLVELYNITETMGVFTSLASLVLTAFKSPDPDVVEEMKKGFAVVNNEIQEIQASIVKLGQVVIRSTQFVQYNRSRIALAYLTGIYDTWLKTVNNPFSFHKFVHGCNEDEPMKFFYLLSNMMDNRFVKEANLAHSMMEASGRLRGPLTQIARLVKSDICQAMLMVSACEHARNRSYSHKIGIYEKAQVIFKMVADRFIDVDRFLVVNASPEIQKHVKEGMQNFPARGPWSANEIPVFVYNRLKDKYYWLKMNVHAFEFAGKGVYFSSYDGPTKDKCIVVTNVSARGRKFQVLVVVWKRGRSENFMRDGASTFGSQYRIAIPNTCEIKKSSAKDYIMSNIDAKYFDYGATGYKEMSRSNLKNISFSDVITGDAADSSVVNWQGKSIYKKTESCTTGGFSINRLLFTVAAPCCSRMRLTYDAFVYP